ncbi:hypothetical protein PTTG_00482 [Puccinia triticina 1-1 BBBD Race 1]|uniref:Phenol 2-monooxygenase n=2 Tax=Puccinia triticina TaxID=208348 RepID=A0A180H5F2_PUCT1|nr:uncharacterized protein PtA15_2A554 [Puccinia triticina]OAV99742.1 hypothetical protein PTTG_00482 [Puccinia triticina 1-1 BBBD Race 1]WAQ82237.1 hypothetical protein PtA15_2A554 [Puccinia triticina]WAR53090.1 hypothetical protein PtB15_2B520 [Puccinia triticina]
MQVKEVPSDVDVLIIGAGPAGLMAAASLARYGIHNVRIVDKRGTKVFTGQADGLNPRSLEVFQALGMGARLFEEVNQLGEICFWNPDSDGKIGRTARIPDTIPGISPYQQSVVHQGRIERMFLDKISEWSTPSSSDSSALPCMKVERAVCPEMLILPPLSASALSDSAEERIIVRLRHLTQEEAQPAQFSPMAPDGIFRSNMFQDDALDVNPVGFPSEEVIEEVRCRFVIGADGARSWTRQAIGYELVGESDDFFWGVLDGVPITNFPDIRMRCAIHSAQNGSVMIIPREQDMVRLYIQIPQPEKGKRPNRADVTPDRLLKAAQSIFAPYTMEIPKIEWYTCYEIGQRLANHWSWNDRVFIAGDACHTHSPKAGQGMNISMADTFNLAWKLAHVLQGRAHPSILQTYEIERAQIAKELIEFDQKFARLFSGKPAKDVLDESGISMEEFQSTVQRGNIFSSGTSVDYPSSLLVSKNARQKIARELASNLPVGPRLYSRQVVGVADAKPYMLGDLACADGRWKILLFGGDVKKYSGCRLRLDKLCKFLADDVASPIIKYTPSDANLDSVFNFITILASPRVQMECDDFHDILRPKQGKNGFQAYKKIFSDDESYHRGHGKIYENYGIDPKVGCMVVVRPDQYVSLVTEIGDHAGLAAFFDSFMLPARSSVSSLHVQVSQITI